MKVSPPPACKLVRNISGCLMLAFGVWLWPMLMPEAAEGVLACTISRPWQAVVPLPTNHGSIAGRTVGLAAVGCRCVVVSDG